MSRTLLVTGATGKQGRALINALNKANADFDILAVTRDATTASARGLLKIPRVQLIIGDLDAPEAIFHAAARLSSSPVWGVFSVQVAVNNKNEAAQGKALVDAAVAHRVSHFVYSSVDRGGLTKSDNDPTDVPHFINKHNIEQHLISKAGKDMNWTILRPVAFYDNLTPDFMGKAFTTAWAAYLRPTKKLQLVATSDIGHFAAQALMASPASAGQKISIAGDELTLSEFGSVFQDTTATPLPMTFLFIARILGWLIVDFGSMYRWFDRAGYGANLSALKKDHPGLKNFETWLRTESQFKAVTKR